MRLEGKKIAILIADGYHEHEFLFPYYRLKEAGAEVLVAGPEADATVYGEGRHGLDGLPFTTTHALAALRAEELDAVHLPGGIYGPLPSATGRGCWSPRRWCGGGRWPARTTWPWMSRTRAPPMWTLPRCVTGRW